MMRISEIFHSIQGEGTLTGTPSVFIRLSGCNLRCTWCDTPYASWTPEGPEMSVEEIVQQTLTYKCTHTVITGGEPLMFKDLPTLLTQLKSHRQHITIETAGTLWQESLPQNSIDLASISPKLANSTPWQREGGRFAQAHEKHRINMDVLRTFAALGNGVIKDTQWKFVVSAESDLPEIESLTQQLQIPPEKILLMPEGTDIPTLNKHSLLLAEICKQKNYRLSPRLHVYLWGNTRAT